jgi:nucleolar protein 56
MKSYIIDTFQGLFVLDETGNILNFIDFNDDNQKIIDFYVSLENDIILKEYENLLLELNNSGFDEFIFDNKKLEFLTSQKLGYKTSLEILSLEFKSFRFSLEEQLKKMGISKSRNEILVRYKEINEALIKRKVSQAGGQSEIIIIQIIETLDILKKSISLFSSRLREWYGLHFPELTDKIVEDNILVARLVSTIGNRENYNSLNLTEKFNFNENLLNLLIKRASESMGANIDLSLVQSYANQILSLDSYRSELEENLEDLMEISAPNLKAIVSSLIGAKLIAKTGGLKKLAYMPASRIQLLGAEKALYRFLKSGEKEGGPKHGLIYQWRQIRGSRPWIRGKISRLIAGKIGLASKIDYFDGEFIGDILTKEIEEKIKEIEVKHPNPPKKIETKKIKYQKKSRKKRTRKRNINNE